MPDPSGSRSELDVSSSTGHLSSVAHQMFGHFPKVRQQNLEPHVHFGKKTSLTPRVSPGGQIARSDHRLARPLEVAGQVEALVVVSLHDVTELHHHDVLHGLAVSVLRKKGWHSLALIDPKPMDRYRIGGQK